MSYDIYMVDRETGEECKTASPHSFAGGTYAEGGTDRVWLNVTYNYSRHFYRVFPGGDKDGKGIRTIYGMTGRESIPVLSAAALLLGNDFTADYWQPTEGNAKKALLDLMQLAHLCPDGVWKGD